MSGAKVSSVHGVHVRAGTRAGSRCQVFSTGHIHQNYCSSIRIKSAESINTDQLLDAQCMLRKLDKNKLCWIISCIIDVSLSLSIVVAFITKESHQLFSKLNCKTSR